MTDEEIASLRAAFEGLYKISEESRVDERGYQWIAGVHGFPPPIYCQHGNMNFPTWHRAYLYEFELRLQEQVSSVTLPYWDWGSERAIQEGIPKVLSDPTYVNSAGETQPNPLFSAFSQVTGTNTVRDPGPPSDLQELEDLVVIAQEQPVYPDYSPALENPHNGLHGWVGGDMGSVPTAAYDPIFWMHHANIDRLWFEWQEVHGDSTVPAGVRSFVCAPFPYTGEETLDTTKFGYTYAESASVATIEEAEQPMAERGLPSTLKFDLGTINHDFTLARIEFQQVEKTEESYRVRVYCDSGTGNYDARSARLGNAKYASTLYLFGHGPCGGATGHCDRPEGPRAWFDLRQPHHLEPYNTYLNVTKAVQNAVAGGKKDVSLSFVVINSKGEQVAPAVIQFKTVSLMTYK